MRTDHHDNLRKSPGRPARAGLDATTVWILMGAALTTACVHDGNSHLVDGGGGTGAAAAGGAATGGAAASTGLAALAAAAAVGVSFSAGGSGGGSGPRYANVQQPAAYAVTDTRERESSPADFGFSAQSPQAGGQPATQRFEASHPDGLNFGFEARLPDGTPTLEDNEASQLVPRSVERSPDIPPRPEAMSYVSDPMRAPRHDSASFDFNRMLEGSYGTLYFNGNDGRWIYEADPAKVNPLRTPGPGDEPREEKFLITAVDERGVESPPKTLTIAVNGQDERTEQGSAAWADSTPGDGPKVGDILTVTLTDNDGIPSGDAAPRYAFFHASDTTGTDRTAIDAEYAAVTAPNTGVVTVAQAHVGRHIGVEITYTDINGNTESVPPLYANPTEDVASHDAKGVAMFDPGIPTTGTSGAVTVRLADANGVPDSVSYQFFYADEYDPDYADRADPSTLPGKVSIGNTGSMPVVKTNGAGPDGIVGNGDDVYSRFATLTAIPAEADDHYIGVDITYRDVVGAADDTARVMLPVAVDARATSLSGPRPRNYGPELKPDHNKVGNLYISVPHDHRGESNVRALVFGERGYRNDPQHTTQDELELTLFNVIGDEPGTMATVDAWEDRRNVIAEAPWDIDYHYDTKYGTFRFDRLDSHGDRNQFEQEGVLFWTYELGRTASQQAAIRADIVDGNRVVKYDQMFIGIRDREGDTDVERLSVEIRDDGVSALPPGPHIPTPQTGAAPTLAPLMEDPIHLSTTVYYEGGMTIAWDTLNKSETWRRELVYGDDDNDNVELGIVFYVPKSPVRVKFTDWLNNRNLLDLDPNYLHNEDFTQQQRDYAINFGWEPGDVAFVGDSVPHEFNQIHTNVGPGALGYWPVRGWYGTFRFYRVDGDPDQQDQDAPGRLGWTYSPTTGDDQSQHISRQPQHLRLANLRDGDYGFDIVYIQIYDAVGGNKSDVRAVMVPIAGSSTAFGLGENYIPRLWLDSYDEIHRWDPFPTAVALPSQQSSPATSDSAYHDGSQEGLPQPDYDIV